VRPLLIDMLIALQTFVVAFVALHDWAPLPPLNDIASVQAADSRVRLVTVTVLSTLPFAFGLGETILHAGGPFPEWLGWYLLVGYGVAVYGMIRAWWGPYLFYEEPARAARYEKMFARTHSFLPMRHGIRPNTLHVILHLAIIAIVVDLIVLQAGRPA